VFRGSIGLRLADVDVDLAVTREHGRNLSQGVDHRVEAALQAGAPEDGHGEPGDGFRHSRIVCRKRCGGADRKTAKAEDGVARARRAKAARIDPFFPGIDTHQPYKR
jgi:hypothetical protein